MLACLFQGRCSQHAGGCNPPSWHDSCHSPLCLVFLSGASQRIMLFHDHWASPNMTLLVHWAFFEVSPSVIRSLCRLLLVFWASALVDVLLSCFYLKQSSLEWKLPCSGNPSVFFICFPSFFQSSMEVFSPKKYLSFYLYFCNATSAGFCQVLRRQVFL